MSGIYFFIINRLHFPAYSKSYIFAGINDCTIMTDDSTRVFRSKISSGLAIAVYAVCIVVFATNMALHFNWIEVSIYIATLAFISDIFFNTRYVIQQNDLQICCGMFFKSHISISTIDSITRTKSLESAPAVSLNRIKVCYGKRKYVIISPRHENEFIKILTKHNPDIEISI